MKAFGLIALVVVLCTRDVNSSAQNKPQELPDAFVERYTPPRDAPLLFIPPPFIEQRTEALVALHPEFVRFAPEDLSATVFEWNNGSLKTRYSVAGGTEGAM